MNPDRPSHGVGLYLAAKGYRIVPVNPGLAGKTLFGETVFASLSDIPPDRSIDLVDVFRSSEAVGPLVEEALRVLPDLRTIWMQLGVHNAPAAELARSKGITVVENRCPKIEYQRLMIANA